jgi:FkbM family methyltransferase
VLRNAKRIIRRVLPAPIYRNYRKWRVERLVSSYTSRVVQHVYAGFPLRVALEDPLAAGWYDHDWALPPELEVLRGLQPKLIFDLGAHQAVVALIAERLTGARVIAVEAEPHNARVARRNVELNGGQIEVVEAAVTERPGEVMFAESLNGNLARPDATTAVRGVTIDELAAEHGHPSVVLLDVEGAELLALRGAEATIAAGAVFVIELHVGCGLEELGGTPGKVLALLDGYDIEVACENGGWRPVHEPITTRGFVFAQRRLESANR